MVKQVTDKSIEDTGERMVPAYHKGKLVYGEHLVRYQALENIVRGKTVLDIASGSGYGTNAISNYADKVFGVDVDQDAVKYAQKNYTNSKIEFLKGDGRDIPLPDNAVDIVVSFETIEHIEDYGHFVKEVKRVLKADGLFVLSTPNDKEFPEGAHFHIHEFEHEELQKLVDLYFTQSKEYFQVTWLYNALLEGQQLQTERTLKLRTINAAPVSTEKAIYFYMLLANREITEEVEPLAAISEHWSDRAMLEHNKEIDAYIKKTIKHYEDMVAEKDKHHAALQKQLAKLQAELDGIRRSVVQRVQNKVKAVRNKGQSK